MSAIMASKKKPAEPPKDQHKAKKMFRVDDDLHAVYKALAERNDRPMSRELRAALIKHAREQGMWPPKP
jgi:predicted HicB family RNase H-like nuclease